MNYYKIKYKDGSFKIVKAEKALDVIRKYDLCTKEHISTRLEQLQGEQLAIAIANDEEKKRYHLINYYRIEFDEEEDLSFSEIIEEEQDGSKPDIFLNEKEFKELLKKEIEIEDNRTKIEPICKCGKTAEYLIIDRYEIYDKENEDFVHDGWPENNLEYLCEECYKNKYK